MAWTIVSWAVAAPVATPSAATQGLPRPPLVGSRLGVHLLDYRLGRRLRRRIGLGYRGVELGPQLTDQRLLPLL